MQAPLRACPTCGGAPPTSLRNYSTWLSLPGRVGPSDIDLMLERGGRFLVVEFKLPGESIPTGQRRLLKHLVRLGVDVWIAWESSARVEVGAMDRNGNIPFVQALTVEEFAQRVNDWWGNSPSSSP